MFDVVEYGKMVKHAKMWSNEHRKTTIAKYKNVLLKINYTDTWANVSYWFRIAVSFARLEAVDRRFRLEKSLAQIREMRGWLRKWEFSTIDRQRVCLFAPELIYLFHQTVAVCVCFYFHFFEMAKKILSHQLKCNHIYDWCCRSLN